MELRAGEGAGEAMGDGCDEYDSCSNRSSAASGLRRLAPNTSTCVSITHPRTSSQMLAATPAHASGTYTLAKAPASAQSVQDHARHVGSRASPENTSEQ
eukprot:469446-Rhodomonas_salina.1